MPHFMAHPHWDFILSGPNVGGPAYQWRLRSKLLLTVAPDALTLSPGRSHFPPPATITTAPVTRRQLDAHRLSCACTARMASWSSKQTSRTGGENKSKLYIVLRHKKKTAVPLSHHSLHIKASVPFHRTRQQKHLRDALPDAAVARCAGVHSLGTNSNQAECRLGLLVITRTEISIHHNALLSAHPLTSTLLRALPLFSQLLLPRRLQCSPRSVYHEGDTKKKKESIKTSLSHLAAPRPGKMKERNRKQSAVGTSTLKFILNFIVQSDSHLSIHWCLELQQ